MKKKLIVTCLVALAVTTIGVGQRRGWIHRDHELCGASASLGIPAQATLEAWLASAVLGYNVANDPDLPASGGEVFRNVNDGISNWPGFPGFGANVTNLQIPVAGFQYLVLHWGGPDAPCNTNQSCAALTTIRPSTIGAWTRA